MLCLLSLFLLFTPLRRPNLHRRNPSTTGARLLGSLERATHQRELAEEHGVDRHPARAGAPAATRQLRPSVSHRCGRLVSRFGQHRAIRRDARHRSGRRSAPRAFRSHGWRSADVAPPDAGWSNRHSNRDPPSRRERRRRMGRASTCPAASVRDYAHDLPMDDFWPSDNRGMTPITARPRCRRWSRWPSRPHTPRKNNVGTAERCVDSELNVLRLLPLQVEDDRLRIISIAGTDWHKLPGQSNGACCQSPVR